MQVADHAVVTPLIYAEDYIETILAYCCDRDIGAVLSLLGSDLPILAANRGRFLEIGVTVLVSDYGITRICNDKWRTRELASAICPAPRPGAAYPQPHWAAY